jgi:hypothetical protein
VNPLKKLLLAVLLAATASTPLFASEDPGPGWYQNRFSRVAQCGLLDHGRVAQRLDEKECRGGFEYRYREVTSFFSTQMKCMKTVNFGDDENEDLIDVREMPTYYCDKVGKDIAFAIRLFDEDKLLDF